MLKNELDVLSNIDNQTGTVLMSTDSLTTMQSHLGNRRPQHQTLRVRYIEDGTPCEVGSAHDSSELALMRP